MKYAEISNFKQLHKNVKNNILLVTNAYDNLTLNITNGKFLLKNNSLR